MDNKTNPEWKPKYEQTERGHWVGRWVRKEGVALHPFWEEKWDLMGVDEAHVRRCRCLLLHPVLY